MAKAAGKLKPRPDRPDAELREIAFDIRAGRVYTNAQVPQHLWATVFMPLAFVDRATLKNLMVQGERNAIVMGHIRDAGPWWVNGYPMFLTQVSFLSRTEFEKIRGFIQELDSVRWFASPEVKRRSGCRHARA